MNTCNTIFETLFSSVVTMQRTVTFIKNQNYTFIEGKTNLCKDCSSIRCSNILLTFSTQSQLNNSIETVGEFQ